MRRFPAGTKLFVGDDILSGTPTYTEVTDVVSVGLPFGYTVDEEETTTHGSAGSDNMKRFESTLADRGEVPFEVFFDWEDATHRNLATLSYGRTKRAFKVELPIQTSGNTQKETYEWDGFIKSFDAPEAQFDSHIRATGSIRMSSDFTRTAEAA